MENAELENIEQAYREISEEYAANEIRKGQLLKRMMALRSGAQELRRKRARNYIDAYLAPVTFYSIEEVRPAFSLLQRFRAFVRTTKQLTQGEN